MKEIRSADRVYLLSRGLSQLVAKEFALKLQIIGCNVFEDSDPLIMQEITSHVKKKELVIIYSLSGKTPELLKAAENAASLGARIITIIAFAVPQAAARRRASWGDLPCAIAVA